MKTQATSPTANNNILFAVVIVCMVMLSMLFAPAAQAVQCDRTITANVVVLDNPDGVQPPRGAEPELDHLLAAA